ncbi:MFS transporter [Pseudarthrobacter sp. J1763]|uniref:MFS transporter n=1 Tax=Pseudarthrobacter sp. J1763 TaxID=3420445 RepID=UPI003D2B38CF
MAEDDRTDWNGHHKGSAAYSRLLAALALAGVATFAQLYSVQATLPQIATELHISASLAALSISAATVGLAVAVIPWSFIADRIGRVKAMTIGICAATALGLILPLCTELPALLAVRLLEGMALGSIPALAVAYLNEEVHKLYAAVAAGSYVAGTTIGGLLGRLVSGVVSDFAGWRFGTLAASLLATLAAVAFLMLLPKQRGFVRARGKGIGPALTLLASLCKDQRLLALYAQAFLLMGGFVALYNYLGFRLMAPPFLLPAGLIAFIFLAYLAGTFTSRWGAAMTVRLGRRAVLLSSIAIMAAGILITIPDNLAAVLIGVIVLTGGYFAAHSVGSGWTGAIAVSGRAQAASLYNLAYYLGSSVIGWAGGLVFQSFGWPALALLVAGLTLLAGLLNFLAHRGRPQTTTTATAL